mgnify:CR=1 FL=1
MASNSLNRIENQYYRVTVVGAIDPESVELYAQDNGDEFPTTNDASLDIERSNMRYEALIRGASTTISPLFTPNIVVTGRTVDSPATQIELTLVYDRPEYLVTEDENNPGTELTGVNAITRFIARALVVDEVENRQIYFPAPTPESALTVQKNQPQIIDVTADALFADLATAEANITVVEIPNLVN